MKDKIEKMIKAWEDVTVGTTATTAGRTAAIISAFSTPETVLEALARLGNIGTRDKPLSDTYAKDIYIVVQYLHSLLQR